MTTAIDRRHELHVTLDGAQQLAAFRRRLRAFLASGHATAQECEAIVLAAVEALNNALQSRETAACQVEATVSLIADHVCVEVRDAGMGAKGVCVSLVKLPTQAGEHGRGLYLMGQLMESLELVPRSQGTLVRMTKRLRRLEARGPADSERLAG